MAGIFKDMELIVSTFIEQVSDFRDLVRTLKGKQYIGEREFKLNVTDLGTFYLNDIELTFITTNSNSGMILRCLINSSYSTTDEMLKKALHITEMDTVYREVHRLKNMFKKNKVHIHLKRLRNGYEITNISF